MIYKMQFKNIFQKFSFYNNLGINGLRQGRKYNEGKNISLYRFQQQKHL